MTYWRNRLLLSIVKASGIVLFFTEIVKGTVQQE